MSNDNKKNSSKRAVILMYTVILILAAALLCLSVHKVYTHLTSEAAATEHNTDLVKRAVTLTATPTPQPTQTPTQEPTPTPDIPAEPEPAEPSFPISVDFEALHSEGDKAVMWLYQPDTVINYPIAQGEDNEYYLDKMTNGYWNPAGSLFVDFRNSADFADFNTIIYGHNMKNDSMFGTLPRYADKGYHEAHPTLYAVSQKGKYLLQVAFAFVSPTDSVVYTFPETEAEKAEFVAVCLENSVITPHITPDADTKFVTLSTCTDRNDENRFVVVCAIEKSDI